MDIRRPFERSFRSMLQRMFGGRTWSLNKMKGIKERLVFLDQVNEMMEDLCGQFGELELSVFTHMLFAVADEHSQKYFRKTVKCVVDEESKVVSSFDKCFYVSDVLKLLKVRPGDPVVAITNFDELKVYLLFGKLPDQAAFDWIDEILGEISSGPVITNTQELDGLIGKICDYAVVLNYLRGDLKLALENSGCLQAMNHSAFLFWLHTQDKKHFLTVTPAEAAVLLKPLMRPSTPDTPQATAPSTPVSEPYSVMNFPSFYDLYTAQESTSSGYFSDITDDEFVLNHSPSFMREPRMSFRNVSYKRDPAYNFNFDMFEDKNSFKAPVVPMMGTFRTERAVPYKIGERVYVDASYLYSLDNRRPLIAESLFVGPFEVSGTVSDGVYILEIPPCFNCSSLLPTEALTATLAYGDTDTERLLLKEIGSTLGVDPSQNTALIQYADGTKSTVRLDALRRAQAELLEC